MKQHHSIPDPSPLTPGRAGAGEPLLVVAGEASGDQRAARLLEYLMARRPQLAPFGMGGEQLREVGMETLFDASEISVVGIIEALRVLPRARRVFRRLVAEAATRGCRAALLVDSPDFNLRLARALHRRGLSVLYYVSPQVWAWRQGRVRLIREVVDRMLVLFPFEVDFYRRHGVEVVHAGHPLVDEVPRLPSAWNRPLAQGEPYTLALLPGSRESEVEALLPVLLAAVERLRRSLPVRARLIAAPSLDRATLERQVESAGVRVEIVAAERYAAIADSHLALCASGTATLEVGLLETPMLVIYRLQPWTYRVARRLVRLPHIGLVNLVLGRGVAPELVQEAATPERIAAEAEALLTSPERVAAMRRALSELRSALGASGASERAAREVASFLAGESA
ncbi:MAG: lipid-A-disaccharide synthase [Thermoanaerobaculia bacterium]